MISISLTKGFVAIVDDEDSDLAQFKWQVSTKQFYAVRRVGGRKNPKVPYMHRIILARILGRDLVQSEIVDHINGDPRDNRRSNLRLATQSQNMRNQRKNKANTSGYKGVSHVNNNPKKPFRAYIVLNDKQIHLGLFATVEDAHAAYCEASKKYHGEFGRIE